MRDVTKRFDFAAIATAVCAGALVFTVSAGAQAYDHWDRDHDRARHHCHDRWHHEHYVHERRVVVRERAPVFVERERPVYVAPPVVYPAYPQQEPSGLNLNFNIPLN